MRTMASHLRRTAVSMSQGFAPTCERMPREWEPDCEMKCQMVLRQTIENHTKKASRERVVSRFRFWIRFAQLMKFVAMGMTFGT